MKKFFILTFLSNKALSLYFLFWLCSLLIFSRVRLYQHLNFLSSEVSDLRTSITSDISLHAAEMFELADLPELSTSIAQRDTYTNNAINEKIKRNITADDHVKKIAIIDASGQEILIYERKDGQVNKIASEHYRSKSDRLYVTDTMKIAFHEVYISNVDLSEDEGFIREPYEPVIRIATPILDTNNTKVGVVVYSLDFQSFLDQISAVDEKLPLETQLLINSEGNWLRGLERDDDWSHIIKNPHSVIPKKNFRERFPLAWQKIKENGKSFTMTFAGVFAFKKIYLINDIQQSFSDKVEPFSYFDKGLDTKDFYHIVISYSTPVEMIKGFLYQVLFPHLTSLSIGIVVLGGLRWYFQEHFTEYKIQQVLKKKR